MIATSKHNKYVSIPDWFGSSSNESTTSETAVGTTTVVISGSGNTGGISGGGGGSTEIPIDNRTIVWSNSLLTVPIDDDKIIVKDGKITTSTTSGLWELREASDGSSYIYTAYPVATQQGITMYVDNNDLDLPSIYDGLPIDNVTIYWALDDNGNKVLKSIGQSGGGVADNVAWVNVTGKPSWLLDDKVQYTEIEGTPDLSGFITKVYVDDNFVTFNLDEEISGIKTFTNGLKIGNSSINQSQEDVIYVDANLVVRGGVTIYADTGDIDIPSLIDSLPIAGYDTVEARGIASFDSSYFSVTNGIVTLIPDNVGLNETELVEYLTNNNYAKKSDIPSLSGYATQSWVESKGYALNSDLTALSTKVNDFLEGSDTDTIINKWLELEAFLSGLSESDNLATILGTKADKTYVDGNFVTLTTQQTISGEKNFTGGLKVNGSTIVYDATNKYWKLEGDLLVTGGVTMYSSDTEFTPSTIMDAIAVDGTTISKDGGVLKVIGDLSGGVTDFWDLENIPSWIGVNKPSYTIGELSNVGSWADSVAPQDRIMYQAANSSQWVAKNLSDLSVGGVTGNYLPLSGGTLTNTLTIDNSNVGLILHRSGQATPYIRFGQDANNEWGELGVYNDGRLVFFPLVSSQGGYNQWNTVWHSGNDGSGSGLDADLLDGKHEWQFYREARGIIASADIDTYTTRRSGSYGVNYTEYYGALFVLGNANNGSTSALEIFAPSYQITISPKIRYSVDNNRYTAWRILAFEDSNVASATKLQTARTIFGQPFDGTGNVNGIVSSTTTTDGVDVGLDANGTSYRLFFGVGSGNINRGIYDRNNASWWIYRDDTTNTLIPQGAIGLGTTSPKGRLHIIQSAWDNGIVIDRTMTGGGSAISVYSNGTYIGNFGISGAQKFEVNKISSGTVSAMMSVDSSGNGLFVGGVTMYSDKRKKTILNHVELSLKEIAEAPLIEHYYNSDEKKTTHVGSIAQYWAGLNDWFCKLDNEGYYTMEIQNAALASAISVARELVKFETETDRRIRLLEEENEQLKKEIEILKWNIA